MIPNVPSQVHAGPFTQAEARGFTPPDEAPRWDAPSDGGERHPTRGAIAGIILACALVAITVPTLSSVSMFAGTPAADVDPEWVSVVPDDPEPDARAEPNPLAAVCPRPAGFDEFDAVPGAPVWMAEDGRFGGSC